ncbi:MAG: hypothetical protein WA063_02725, partial [Minisyncoccia bacterium]
MGNMKSKLGNMVGKYKVETIIAALAVILSSLMAWRVYSLGLTRILVDQNSHLNIARQITDSMTPGITQLGFWVPLIHILMMPFVIIEPLYRTGLAGFFTLLPFLAIAAIFLYKTCLLITKNNKLSFWASIIFLLNPYVLYYAVTPMTEVLYIANLIATAYFIILWMQTKKLSYLLICGIFISLASLSRFEGLILIPIVSLIVLIQLIRTYKDYYKVEATALLFFIIAILGFAFILLYGYIFGKGNPFAFVNNELLGFHRQGTYLLPAEGSIMVSFQYLLHAAYHMISKPFAIASLVCLPILLLLIKPRLKTLSVAFI